MLAQIKKDGKLMDNQLSDELMRKQVMIVTCYILNLGQTINATQEVVQRT